MLAYPDMKRLLAFGCFFLSCSSQTKEAQLETPVSPPPLEKVESAQSKTPQKAVASVQFGVKSTTVPLIELEIADTPAKTSRGLMYRSHLPPDKGMLFIFATERKQSFWMKNTLIPLDMIFINADYKIVGIVKSAEPQTTSPRGVEAESRFVVEVNGGFTDKYGVDVNSTVEFKGVESPLL